MCKQLFNSRKLEQIFFLFLWELGGSTSEIFCISSSVWSCASFKFPFLFASFDHFYEMSIESCLSRVYGELCACEEKVQSIIRTMVSCYTQRASAWRRKRQGGVNSNRETMKPGSWHKWLQHLKSGSQLHIFFSFSISLFTNDLCFNIWHSKTSAMPSCGGISLLCWELKFQFWNFSLLDLWRTLSSDIALCLRGFCALLLEEKKITKQKHVHFHLLRAGSGGSLTEAMLGCEVSEQGTWSGITMSIADSKFLTNQGRINCRNSEMKYIIHLQIETLSPLEIMGTIGLPKCGYLGAFGSLKEAIHIVHFYTAVLDVIKMGLQVVAW